MTSPEDSGPQRVPLAGSERAVRSGARLAGPTDPGEQIMVTVVVRRRTPADPAAAGRSEPHVLGLLRPGERRHLSPEEFATLRGADPADLDRVTAFAGEHGLDVVAADSARRSVTLSGRAADMAAAFGVELARYEDEAGSYRGREGPVRLPADLDPVVDAVLGLDDRAQARPLFRPAEPAGPMAGTPAGSGVRPAAAAAIGFTAPQVAQLYDFPTGTTGSGQCIALIELGGGYRDADLTAYFVGLGIPTPTVVAVGVDGAANAPTGDPAGPDGEVTLDIEVAGAVAPGARIAVYFAPNTDQGFLDAVTTAVHDSTNKPAVLSISWGAPESAWTAQAMQAMDAAFADAATLGLTVCVAAGDGGSADGVTDGKAHADFPSSSPHALGCGGTHLAGSGKTISAEAVWNDGSSATGGGISDTFPLPDWQRSAGVPPSVNPGGRVGRGVPDVAGDADPASGYRVLVDGSRATYGGTSAVAPLWAGLLALVNAAAGSPIGYLNPLIYGGLSDPAAFHDITVGDNTVGGTPGYRAAPGWDACTGLGSPDGARLLAALTGAAPPAGSGPPAGSAPPAG